MRRRRAPPRGGAPLHEPPRPLYAGSAAASPPAGSAAPRAVPTRGAGRRLLPAADRRLRLARAAYLRVGRAFQPNRSNAVGHARSGWCSSASASSATRSRDGIVSLVERKPVRVDAATLPPPLRVASTLTGPFGRRRMAYGLHDRTEDGRTPASAPPRLTPVPQPPPTTTIAPAARRQLDEALLRAGPVVIVRGCPFFERRGRSILPTNLTYLGSGSGSARVGQLERLRGLAPWRR